MSNITVPGNALLPDDAEAWRILGQGTGANEGDTLVVGGWMLLLGFDATAQGGNNWDCVAQLILNDAAFYINGQQTGEELCIAWAWRGQVPLLPEDVLNISLTSTGVPQWGFVAWGISCARPTIQF